MRCKKAAIWDIQIEIELFENVYRCSATYKTIQSKII